MNPKSEILSRHTPGGFSLVELLVTVALICILSVMMFGFGSARRQHSQKELCRDNLQKLYLALQIYAKDFNGRLPSATNAATAEDALDVLVPRYSADTALFICPGGRDAALPSGAPLRSGKISYAYYAGRRLEDSAAGQQALMSDRQVSTLAKLAGDQVFSTTGRGPGNNHHKYGGNFLMGDGSAQDSPPLAPFPLPLPPGVTLLNPKP
jgi:prepilin-type N-terminal cleavage/methylation domain-containing protein